MKEIPYQQIEFHCFLDNFVFDLNVEKEKFDEIDIDQ